jgi:SAM-dependent methyltransferase
MPRTPPTEGWHGWDDYAPFYDWENTRTVGRRDVRFWQRLAARIGGPALELGCGTGRVLVPLVRAGASIVGVDRSAAMLRRARRRLSRGGLAGRGRLVRGDIRALPFTDARFDLVIAPYGILQSLLSDRDLTATLSSVASVLTPGGVFGMDLVPDVPHWAEYDRHVALRGRRGRGTRVTLIESVRQDRRRGLTLFDQEFVEVRGRERHVRRFTLTFRTLPVRTLTGRLARAGFRVDAVLGDYDGRPWDPRASTWLLLARKSP